MDEVVQAGQAFSRSDRDEPLSGHLDRGGTSARTQRLGTVDPGRQERAGNARRLDLTGCKRTGKFDQVAPGRGWKALLWCALDP